MAEECRAVRAGVGVLDQTSFAKFELSGAGAEGLLDRLCANALPAEAGRIALTQMCTETGGVECDVTVTRLAEGRFYVVSAAATETHDLAWIERHLPEDCSVRLDNVTDRYGVLTLAGPRSRDLLGALTTADLSREGFPFFRCRELEIGMAPVRVLRVSYVGELGYELHHPLHYSRHLYEQVLAAGEPLGLVDFGYRALESLRLEKAYRLWGPDLSQVYTPLESGMERFVRFEKGDFIGREALLRQRERARRGGWPASPSTRTTPTRTGTSLSTTASRCSATSHRAASATPSARPSPSPTSRSATRSPAPTSPSRSSASAAPRASSRSRSTTRRTNSF